MDPSQLAGPIRRPWLATIAVVEVVATPAVEPVLAALQVTGNTVANLGDMDPTFGTNTLTKVDGRRVVAINDMTLPVDLNIIPSATAQDPSIERELRQIQLDVRMENSRRTAMEVLETRKQLAMAPGVEDGRIE